MSALPAKADIVQVISAGKRLANAAIEALRVAIALRRRLFPVF
jgi:hypothetical protein